MKSIILVSIFLISAFAWEGYSYEKGNYIDVESYDHQGQGEGEVEYYDYDKGKYQTSYLDMYSGTIGTITNDETGESFDVEME